jgi:hypothetical protein
VDLPAVFDGGPNMYFSLDGGVVTLDLRGNTETSSNGPTEDKIQEGGGSTIGV